MLTLHHLETSRSTRALWLLEAIGVPYEMVRYARTPQRRAPEALKALHPLGKAPVLVDGDLVLAESSAILRYLDRRYAEGRFSPPAGSDDAARHDEWLDFIEGSAGLPIMLTLLGGMTGGLSEGLAAFTTPELKKVLTYIEAGVAPEPYLMGAQLTLADIQLAYFLEVLSSVGLLGDYPAATAYLARLHAEPALIAAIEKGGPMAMPRR